MALVSRALAPFSLLLLAAPLALAAPAAPVVSPAASFHYGAPLAADRAVRLDVVIGSIEATPSDDGKLDVRAVVKSGDPARARVVAREEAGGVAICVLFPEDTPEGCVLDGSHRHDYAHHEDPPRVDLIARVPRGVRLVAHSVDGAITARGLTGDVRAHTVNGDVAVSTTGVAEATTVNGAVDASFGTPPKSRAAFTTTNGPVHVTFPRGTDADVECATVVGALHATFPLDVQATPGGWGPKHGRARLGHGGVEVKVATVNGDVDLRME